MTLLSIISPSFAKNTFTYEMILLYIIGPTSVKINKNKIPLIY